MQSDIGYPDRVAENITSSVTLPGDTTDGWANSSTFLRGFVWTNGMRYVTSSFTGDADMGVSHYGISVGCTDQALEFQVHGGDAEVVLIEQTQTVPTAIPDVPGFYLKLKRGDYGPVVETVIGPQSITPGHEISVRSDLRRHHGKMMRLFVIDALTQVWGFISVSEIRHFFTSANSPAYIYVDRAHTDLPFLGTPGCPFPTLIAGYNAATDSACAANVLKIRVGHYPEALTLNKPITLNAEGGAATIGPP
jgi:hypothetical protein